MDSYAEVIPSEAINASGSLTRFPTAVHREHNLCLDAAIKIRDDFASKVEVKLDAKTIGRYPGLGPVHVVAFTIPECLPERLALMTRFTDFTILNDDFYDTVDTSKVAAFNAELQRSLRGDDNSSSSGHILEAKTKQFQASILVEMMKMDRDLAMDVMSTYSNGLQVATSPPAGINTLEEYLPVRLVNCGLDVFQEMSCFGIGLRLTRQEKEKLSAIVNTALYTAALINDFHSWPKELQYHLETPSSEIPFNAVYILMKQYKCSDADALRILRARYVELQEHHLQLVRRLEESEGMIPDAHRKYIMAAQYAASGSEYWSIFAPRYPRKKQLKQSEYVITDGNLQRIDNASTDSLCSEQETTDSVLEEAPIILDDRQKGAPLPPLQVRAAPDKDSGVKDSGSELNDRVGGASSEPSSAVAKISKTTSDECVKAPYTYISSLPSKKIREKFIDALDYWLKVPSSALTSIKLIIGLLHHSSLMLDDIEDDSILRRGQPTTHTVFGVAQTINSANHAFVRAFEELQNLKSPLAAGVFIEELKNLHCGQALDLHWKYHVKIPDVEDYLMMVDNKTGGLFKLCARLMEGESTIPTQTISSDSFITLLGRFFQIRDDYQNLMSDEYTSQKGFCEDLDEGKISLPLIFCLAGNSQEQVMIKGILQHKATGELSKELKLLILEQMKKQGALEQTYALLQCTQDGILRELKSLECQFGAENSVLELVLRRLWI